MRKFTHIDETTELKVAITQAKKEGHCSLTIEQRTEPNAIFVHKMIFNRELFLLFDALQEKHKLRFAVSCLEMVTKSTCPTAMTQSLLLGLVNGSWSIATG